MSHIEHVIDRGLCRSPLLPLFHWRAARRLTVLAYHAIDDPDRFGLHLDEIHRRSSAVTLDEALAGAEGGPLPRSAVLITFDDGDRTVVDIAAPMLVERGMPAAVFVVAGVLDSDSPLWFDEARRLVRQGGSIGGLEDGSPDDVCRALKRMPDAGRLRAMELLRRSASGAPVRTPQLASADLPALESMGIAVGNHTLTHPCLSRCSSSKATSEIVLAHRRMESALGHPPTAFAYPDGDHDDRASAALRELGYRGAFLFDHRWVSPPVSDPFRISRARVDARTTVERFRLILSGVHPAIHHARGGA
jgi:peptidoglycan/xylan/chitin deacetylase (PgdA/CDA1 family)